VINEFSWLIPIAPLSAALKIAFLSYKNKFFSKLTALGAVGFSLIYTLVLFFSNFENFNRGSFFEKNITWLKAGNLEFSLGIMLDPLCVLMLFLVCLVSFLVQLYSDGYMKKDPEYTKFYLYLSLFTFSMLFLVMSTNLFQIYIFWELVGLCSFLLIGFWSYKNSASQAAFKAFITNRIGDCGLLIGLLILAFVSKDLWANLNLTFLSISGLEQVLHELQASGTLSQFGWISFTSISLLILLGPIAKSAQFPLHIWLPDAMEGPTPISALIHAATMVAAGVFLLARLFPLYEISSFSLNIILIIGLFTAFFSATIALVQTDIKKALAYSTCSQLGYMIIAIGTGNWVAGVFHLFTHAFFKALLFLGAGSVIHGCHHEQDLEKFGGLAKKMPITHLSFLIGTIALAGIPPLAGFWSKEQIIHSTLHSHSLGLLGQLAFWVSCFVAGLTAFYSFRIYLKTFAGEYRGKHQVQESSKSMTIPLVVLAVFSIIVGLLGTNLKILGGNLFSKYLVSGNDYHSIEGSTHLLKFFEFVGSFFLFPNFIPILFLAFGGLFAYFIYVKNTQLETRKSLKKGVLYRFLLNKWYIDEIYLFLLNKLLLPIFKFAWKLIDEFIINLVLIRTIVDLNKISGWLLSKFGTGHLQLYLLNSVIFVLLLLILLAIQV